MDKFGVPKKINRHVIKAIFELTDQNSENSDLLSICDAVEFSMKNNVPVPNLLSSVRQSLLHLCKLGILRKQGTNYYRNSENSASFSGNRSKRVIKPRKFEKAVSDEEIESFRPIAKKRSLLEDPITEYHQESSMKLPRRKKLISRKVKKANLPKVRKHKLNETLDEMEHEPFSSSWHESKTYSEDENADKPIFSLTELTPVYSADILTRPKLVKIEYDNKSENLLKSFSDNNFNQVQNNQLVEFDYNPICNQNIKLDIINENQSHQVTEDTNISDSSQLGQQNESLDFLENKIDENTDGVTNSAQNIDDDSTKQMSECNYLI